MHSLRPTPSLSTEIAAAAYHAVQALAAPLRAFNDWRKAAALTKRMHTLSNRELADLGMVRGDVELIADRLVSRHR
ncbi:MAG: hypothetical protein AAFQ36_08120 [Pseudomonadota bacterium]